MNVSVVVARDGRQVVGDFFRRLNERDLAGLREFMAPDLTDHNRLLYGEQLSPLGLCQQLALFDPLRLRVEELMSQGDRVMARLTLSGVHSGRHPGLPPPSGRSFCAEAIYIFTLRGERIREIRAVSDQLSLFRQLGWSWPAGTAWPRQPVRTP